MGDVMEEIINAINFQHSWDILICPCVLMLCDIITGFLYAWTHKCISSTKLRNGIVHKFVEILIIVVSIYLSYSLGIPETLSKFASGYIIVMEIISIIENAEKLGVVLPKSLTDRLDSIKKEGEDNGKK